MDIYLFCLNWLSLEEGEMMIESENLKQMLKKLITDTENDKIQTAEQMIQTMIYELTSNEKINKQHEGISSAIHSNKFHS